MGTFLWILYLILFLYWVLLLARLVAEFVQSLARHWRPHGFAVVVMEVVFTLTDPPLKALRRVLKPVDLGAVRLDLSLFLVLIVVTIGMRIAQAYAQHLAPATPGMT
ncbi:YggT family protein [Gordonia caeni]|uniref:YggT family protein n=1 Tax=Gordonia caeni TaxID=1007097 RepID=A0ABP7PG99_9ACTN